MKNISANYKMLISKTLRIGSKFRKQYNKQLSEIIIFCNLIGSLLDGYLSFIDLERGVFGEIFLDYPERRVYK